MKRLLGFVMLAVGCGGADPAVDTEVTVGEFAKCVAAGKCEPPRTTWAQCTWRQQSTAGNLPVNCVDWSQAQAYCSFVKKKLPSEGEWAAAAKAAPPAACQKQDNSGPCPVTPKDYASNVKEWTSTSEKLPDGEAARVIRGGGWQVDPLDPAPATPAQREALPPNTTATDLGFRCK